MSNAVIYNQLENVRVNDITMVREDVVIYVDRDSTLKEAIAVLVQNKQTTVPVIQKTQNKFDGLLTVLDIFAFFAENIDGDFTQDAIDGLLNKTVNDIYKSEKINFHGGSILRHQSAGKAMEMMAKGEHEIVVLSGESKYNHDQPGNILSRVTQSSIMEQLNKIITDARTKDDKASKSIVEVASQNVQELGMFEVINDEDKQALNPYLHAVTEDQTVMEAVELLITNKLQGLPVVGTDNRLVGNFSINDFRGVDVSEWGIVLGMQLSAFLKNALTPKSVAPDATLMDIISTMSSENIRRLWIVNEAKQPIGIVSVTDVMKFLVGDMLMKQSVLRYFTPTEIASHNGMDDCWVSLLGRVYDITPLIAKNIDNPLISPLVKAFGEDISHWFDNSTYDVKTYIDPITATRNFFTPQGRFLHLPESFTSDYESTPWWKDNQYVIGLLSCKTRKIKIVNMLTHQEHVLEVCQEETLNQILMRYEAYNEHAISYTWKRLGEPLDMEKTLAENRIPDEDAEFEKLGIAQKYYPVIHIYFNDDLRF